MYQSFSLYTINFPKYWLVRDEPADRLYSSEVVNSPHTSMKFHVSAGDYISTLATILKFFEESVKDGAKVTPEMRQLQLKTAKDVINDLLYLNKNYKIVPKDKGKE